MAALFAIATVCVVPGAAADNLIHKKKVVQHKLAKVQTDFDESSRKVRKVTEAVLAAETALTNAQNNLASTQTQLAAAQVLDNQMQLKLNAATARLDQANSDLAKGKHKVEVQSQQLAQVAVDNYEAGDPALLGMTVVFQGEDPTQVTFQLESMQSVMDKQQSMFDSLKASKIILQLRKQQVASAEKEVASERQAAAENLVTMQTLEQQAAQQEAQVQQLLANKEAVLQQAKKSKHLAYQQVQKLKKERRRIHKMIMRRASHTYGKYNGPGGGNGFFDMPVKGPITSPYGWRIQPIYGYWELHDGIDIGANCGTPIRAPAAGKVISEYYSSGWGNRLFLDHGIHYGVGLSTIYNHMSGYVAHVGEKVKRGQIIGYVGTTGWSTGCHLHWTVMENGQTVDPMKWL